MINFFKKRKYSFFIFIIFFISIGIYYKVIFLLEDVVEKSLKEEKKFVNKTNFFQGNTNPYIILSTKEQEILQQNFFKKYSEIYNKMFDEKTPLSEKRFIILKSSPSGLGNEIHAAISGILFAMMSERAIINEGNRIFNIFESAGNIDFSKRIELPNSR